MKVRYLPDALRELNESVAYYHERAPLAARRFAEAVRQEESRILEFPKAAPEFEGQHFRLVPHYPYTLIYRLLEREILIIAVAHHRRRPGYWKTRLGNTH